MIISSVLYPGEFFDSLCLIFYIVLTCFLNGPYGWNSDLQYRCQLHAIGLLYWYFFPLLTNYMPRIMVFLPSNCQNLCSMDPF
uniref:Uncharacterized protein n=1 Tax=Rhizophora mucronata TaxID=61149 RepID=A0A2P2PVE9_RHIMU